MHLPVKTPEIVSVFIEASKNLRNIFLNNYDTKNLKTISAYTESRYRTDLIFMTFKKLFISRHCPFKLYLSIVIESGFGVGLFGELGSGSSSNKKLTRS